MTSLEELRMTDVTVQLLKAHLKQLRLPAMVAELEKLSREAAASNQSYEQFLLQLAEVELAARAANALSARIKNADFPVMKDFDTYDFGALPNLPKPKLLELARGEWIAQKYNCCFIGSPGTGKPRPA
jgi:DNA replication protein DnaC